MVYKEESKNTNTAFIHKVIAALEPIVMLAKEEQITDLVKFCTKDNFFIFQIDLTFNIGSLVSNQYEHLNLLRVMVGPIMIHQQKTLEAYKTFSRFLINGDKNLPDARQSVFKNSKHVRCFIHFETNLNIKLI